MVSGRLAAYRAELDLASGRLDDALMWCTRAIELAEQGSRRKYLANAKTTLGRVLTAQGEAASATAELRSAVALADELGSPLLRWQARAALSRAEREMKGGSDDADRHAEEAADIIHAVAEIRLGPYAARRVERIVDLLGNDAVKTAQEVRSKFAKRVGSRNWIGFCRYLDIDPTGGQ